MLQGLFVHGDFEVLTFWVAGIGGKVIPKVFVMKKGALM